MSTSNLRERAAHLYRHPEDATPEDVRSLVVMSEALRECRAGDIRDRYLMLSLWSSDGQRPRLMVSDPLATDEEIMETAAGILTSMGLKPKEEP